MFPTPYYTILQSFLVSTAAYVAIGCVVIVIVMPESLNHQMINGVSKLLSVLHQLVEIQDQVLRVTDPGDLSLDLKLAAQIQAMTTGTFSGIQTCKLIWH